MNRLELLKDFLIRLNDGEALDRVKKDFLNAFYGIDAIEIVKLEEELKASGVDISWLCDLHSSLFHDNEKSYVNKNDIAALLTSIKGHPLETLKNENDALAHIIDVALDMVKNNSIDDATLNKLKNISVHYAKKGDIIYPILKGRYNVTGPSDVMWTNDDEIRDTISYNIKRSSDERFYLRLNDVLTKAREMIFKENNILFPICAVNFTVSDWNEIYFDLMDYDQVDGAIYNTWDNAVKYEKMLEANDEIKFSSGHLKLNELNSLLNTIPLEITFVDKDDINRYFNEGHKVFKRPLTALDRSVYLCHPPKFEILCRKIIDDFKNGSDERVDVWMNKNNETYLVSYLPVRDKNGTYLGITELVQNMEFAKKHFNKE